MAESIAQGIASADPEVLVKHFNVAKTDGLRFKGKKAAAFGSYGWSGEGVENINARLRKAGFELVNEGLKALGNPDEPSLKACRDFGAAIALATK